MKYSLSNWNFNNRKHESQYKKDSLRICRLYSRLPLTMFLKIRIFFIYAPVQTVTPNSEFVTFWPPMAKPRIKGDVTNGRYGQLHRRWRDRDWLRNRTKTLLCFFILSFRYDFCLSVLQRYQTSLEKSLSSSFSRHTLAGGWTSAHIYIFLLCLLLLSCRIH